MKGLPAWLRRPLPPAYRAMQRKMKLPTVCRDALCPNRFECFSKKRAAFLALGHLCTRSCRFCNIAHGKTPLPPDETEIASFADAIIELDLAHAVITMVSRDDLPDGGANHMAAIIREIKRRSEATVEVLVSDFKGQKDLIQIVTDAAPDIFNHNIETVPSLTAKLRDKANYNRSLGVLSFAKSQKMQLKSGLMVGLGETKKEVFTTLADLKNIGCDIITIGQYLQPHKGKYPVQEFIHPDIFKEFAAYGESLGIPFVYSGPLIRSSYNSPLYISET